MMNKEGVPAEGLELTPQHRQPKSSCRAPSSARDPDTVVSNPRTEPTCSPPGANESSPWGGSLEVSAKKAEGDGMKSKVKQVCFSWKMGSSVELEGGKEEK